MHRVNLLLIMLHFSEKALLQFSLQLFCLFFFFFLSRQNLSPLTGTRQHTCAFHRIVKCFSCSALTANKLQVFQMESAIVAPL